MKKTKENLAERKEQQKLSDKPKSAGRPLSEKEAEELRETYTLALSSIFNFMDDGIRFTTGGHQEPDIWSSIDDDDLKIIVDARLRAATLSAKDAAKVKRTIRYWEKTATYVIVLPRVWQTLQFYSEHGLDIPIKMRRRRKLKVVAADERGA